MSTFGIDHQSSLTYVVLGDGAGGGLSANPVGDGFRDVIPHLAGRSAWASAAVSDRPDGELYQNLPGQPGAWLEKPGASLFWRGLADRLAYFLGGIPPTLANGYQCVIALATDSALEARDRVRQLAGDAGMVDAECIRASEALLCDWLGSFIPEASAARTIVTVVCSDSLILARAFKVAFYRNGQSEITPSDIEVVIPVGHGAFVQRVLAGIATRNREDLATRPLKERLCLEEAVLSFASRLRRVEAHVPVLWTGPFREQLFTNFRLAPEQCRTWPESIAIESQLPKAISEVTRSLGSGSESEPDEVVIGGIGSVWPCFADALKGMKCAVSFRDPERAVALGATIWPEVRSGFMSVPPTMKNFSEAAPGSESPPGESATAGEPAAKPLVPVLPPWER